MSERASRMSILPASVELDERVASMQVWPPVDREVVVIGKLGVKAADFVVEFGQQNAFHKEPSAEAIGMGCKGLNVPGRL